MDASRAPDLSRIRSAYRSWLTRRAAQMSSTSASVTPTPSPTLSSTVHRGSRSPPAAPPTLTITPPGAGASASGGLEEKTGGLERPGNRRRSSSIVHVEKIQMSPVELLDQSAGFNANAEWVNYKGAWVIHVVLIVVGKILLDVVPGMEQDTSWTCVNLSYIAVSAASQSMRILGAWHEGLAWLPCGAEMSNRPPNKR